jgi:hypothetical protein
VESNEVKLIEAGRAGCQWLIPIILATQEADQKDCGLKLAWANSSRDTFLKKTLHKKKNKKKNREAGGVAQGIGCGRRKWEHTSQRIPSFL